MGIPSLLLSTEVIHPKADILTSLPAQALHPMDFWREDLSRSLDVRSCPSVYRRWQESPLCYIAPQALEKFGFSYALSRSCGIASLACDFVVHLGFPVAIFWRAFF